MMINLQKIVMASAFALSLSVMASGQTAFNVVTVKGTSPHALTAINNSSQVVAATATSGSSTASVWNRSAGLQDLGMAGMNSGGAAIDAAGEVVGAGDPDHTGVLQAFIWRPDGGAQWLGSLGGGLSAASGVNNSGSVVGLSYNGTNNQHAFFWTPDGGMQDLTPDLTSIGGATALAINSSNQVVGYYYPNGSKLPVGFSWTQDGGLQNLGLSGTLPLAINDAGTVVGQAPNASAFQHAFSWTQDGGMTDLGTLGGGTSTALGVNSKGWIVGTSLTSSSKGLLHGFLWTPAGGMQDLTVLAGLSKTLQPYSVQVNDYGVVAISTNLGLSVLIPKMMTALSSSANPSKLGQAVTFTATVGSIAGPPPDGEIVQFTVGGKLMGSATLTNGVAQFTTTAVPAGSHVVVVNYNGDTNYLPSTYKALQQVVTR